MSGTLARMSDLRARRLPLLISTLLFATACVRVVKINDQWVAERIWLQEREDLRTRGAADLSCPIDDVVVALLDSEDEYWPLRVEVEGCEQRRRYVHQRDGWEPDTTEPAPAAEPATVDTVPEEPDPETLFPELP